MTSGVLITLTICITIILLFGTIMIAAVALNKQKKQDQVNDYQQRSDFLTNVDFQPKDGKH